MSRGRGVMLLVCVSIGSVSSLEVESQESAGGDWPYYGGDRSFTRYSPLDQITRDNVKDLEIVWRRPATASRWTVEAFPELDPSHYLRSTPLMINGVLYASNALGFVEAFDPATGETLWVQEPVEMTLQEVSGSSTRGLDIWSDGVDGRLFLVRGRYLYAINAATGARYEGFGLVDQGRVDLNFDVPGARNFNWTAGPIVVGDVVVVAGTTGGAGDGGIAREAAPEDVRGFDVRTGRLLWTFHVVPHAGEFGADTWGDGSREYSGDLGSWCCLTADEELGYVFVPLSAPTGMVYGGHRPGDNLFADSLVALDAATGERVWHFQMVHHDVWEYDTVGPPTLGDITVDGRRIKAVMQPSKTAFLYVFDRETRLIQDFTDNAAVLAPAVASIPEDELFDSTNLYGAIIDVSDTWQDEVSMERIVDGSLVIFTDGFHNADPNLEIQDAVNAMLGPDGKLKKIYVAALNSPDLDRGPLQQLTFSTMGFFEAGDISALQEIFLDIQGEITDLSNSFYLLTYTSPITNPEASEELLEVAIVGNSNTDDSGRIRARFDSEGFGQ